MAIKNIILRTTSEDVRLYLNEKYPAFNKDEIKESEFFVENIDDFIKDLCKIIIKRFEKPLISKLIKSQYCYYTEEEVQVIYNKVIKYIYDAKYEYSHLFRKSRDEIICSELNKYFSDNNYLNLEGFIHFRLTNYIEELVDIISISVEEFIIDKEYEEFIGLMQSYVALQKSQYRKMDIVMSKNNFLIFDENGVDITTKCINNYFGTDLEIIFRFEDLLLNILVTSAPKEIVIHKSKDNLEDEIITTLQKIFNNKLTICNGCSLCNKPIAENSNLLN